ncbi:PRC-barrel domain containing protein [Candidatus Poribacteria bacterium]|nr:PRC-barrel domain containing protein [Candidatus Poribacteria bacterium]
MLRVVKEIYDYNIRTTDGKIGEVNDFYFDDQFWKIRYLVVDTSKWLSGKKVLISPIALGEPNWVDRELPVSLTKVQVKESPDVDTDKPISRQQEVELHEYYSWPFYWDYEALANVGKMVNISEKKKAKIYEGKQDLHLRSMKEIVDYNIDAVDGEIGKVQDFVIEDKDWFVRYMVVDTRKWLPGKKVLISPEWVDRISWSDSRVYVDLPQEKIRNSPEFDPKQPVNREYEERLYDFYGRPRYWI